MAITLRRDTGTALTFDQLDDNFVDYSTFKGKFDDSQWIGSNDGKLLFFNVTTGKLELKTLSASDLAAGFSSNFTSTLASKNTDDLSEGTTNLYYTSARSYSDVDIRLATKTTTDISEGTRLYFTNSRADARITNAGSANWNTAYGWGNHASAGYLTTISSQTIGTLSDVDVTGATNGKILKYNGSQWVVATDDNSSNSITLTDLSVGAELTPSGDGAISYNNTTGVFSYTPPDLSTYLTDITGQQLTTLSDVNVTGATNGQILKYNSSTSKWEAQADAGLTSVALGDISNVTISTPSSGQTLQYNGTIWVNSSSGGGPADTDSLAEGSTNLYYTDARADARVNLQTGANLNLSSKTTDNLSEGSTSLYFTNARARAAISEGSTQLAYNSSTGVLTFTQGNTDTVIEGSTNLYFTTGRIDAHLNQSNPTSGYVLSWNGSDYAWVAQTGGSGLTDGDKGDITVSSSGATWTIDNDSINADKIANDAVGIAELSATGTPSSTTYLRGDNTWATVSGGGSSFDQNLNTTDSPTFAGLTLNGSGNVTFTSVELTFDVSNRAKVTGGPFRLARMTTTERNAISSPVGGDTIFNTTTSKFQGYDGTTWVDLN